MKEKERKDCNLMKNNIKQNQPTKLFNFLRLIFRFKKKKYGRAYINFIEVETMKDFVKRMQGQVFTDDRGVSSKIFIEYAPYQGIPLKAGKKNPREGTIEKGKGKKKQIKSVKY